ncbi:MAG TPA: alpha-L-rhamnosidase C-terminal domain-containing protein, partial [Verrucomicrobiota bacterium]|nr:alpha-L-rhamnosidase C-terminal domain-containing protein [Verrucomicrobiota bacterium]
GMACSVYGSQFLMDAIYEAHDSDYALERLLAKDDRGWFNMIQLGSTITLEAWDNKYKNNLDWNHAWGAAPANIITRKLVGVEPLEAGFKKIRIKPQIASLDWIKAEAPSIRGTIRVSANQTPGSEFTLSMDIPAGVTAEVWLPAFNETGDLVQLNGREILTTNTDSFHLVREVGSGLKTFRILKK